MKTFGLLLVVAGLAFAAAPAVAQSTTATIYANQDGGNFVWEDAAGNNNPTIAVTPGQEITLTLVSKNGFHNGRVGSAVSADFDSEADDSYPEQVELKFTAGAEGGKETLKCDYHTTMLSTINFGAASTTNAGGDGDAKKSPGLALLGVALAAIGAALLARRKA